MRPRPGIGSPGLRGTGSLPATGQPSGELGVGRCFGSSTRDSSNSRLDRPMRVCLDSRFRQTAIANLTGLDAPDPTREWSRRGPMTQEAGSDPGGHSVAPKVEGVRAATPGAATANDSACRCVSLSGVSVSPTRPLSSVSALPSWLDTQGCAGRAARAARGRLLTATVAGVSRDRRFPSRLAKALEEVLPEEERVAILLVAPPHTNHDQRWGSDAPAFGRLQEPERPASRDRAESDVGADSCPGGFSAAYVNAAPYGDAGIRDEVALMPGYLDWIRRDPNHPGAGEILVQPPQALHNRPRVPITGAFFLTGMPLLPPRFAIWHARRCRIAFAAEAHQPGAKAGASRRPGEGRATKVLPRILTAVRKETHGKETISWLRAAGKRYSDLLRGAAPLSVKGAGTAEKEVSRIGVLTPVANRNRVPAHRTPVTNGDGVAPNAGAPDEESVTDESRFRRQPLKAVRRRDTNDQPPSCRLSGGGGRSWCARRTGPSLTKSSRLQGDCPCHVEEEAGSG